MTLTLFMVVSRNGVYAFDGGTDISGFSSYEDREFFLSSLRSFDACIMGARSCSHEVPVKNKYILSNRLQVTGNRLQVTGNRLQAKERTGRCQKNPDSDPIPAAALSPVACYLSPDENTFILSGSPTEIYNRIAADGNKKTALIGGAVTDIGFLEAGLVDEMFITVEPVTLPGGLVFDYGPYLEDFTLEEIIPLNEAGTKVMRYTRNTEF